MKRTCLRHQAVTPPAMAPRENRLDLAAPRANLVVSSPSEAIAVTEEAAPAPAPAAGDSGRQGTPEHERKQPDTVRPQRAHLTVDPPGETASQIPGVKPANHWTPSGALRQEVSTEETAAPPPDAVTVRPESAGKLEPKPELQPALAHEIKLEVSGGERRVEVRLSERAGEVRVAVRTPDGQLAGSLRENLPELATRLADTGLRSEMWRPAAPAAEEWRHTSQSPSGNLTQDADQQSKGNGGGAHGDGQRQNPQNSQEHKTQKEKGKDFAWLMSSLR